MIAPLSVASPPLNSAVWLVPMTYKPWLEYYNYTAMTDSGDKTFLKPRRHSTAVRVGGLVIGGVAQSVADVTLFEEYEGKLGMTERLRAIAYRLRQPWIG